MDKEFLKGLGIEGENADKIINQHKADIKDKYIPIERFNEVNTDLKNQKDTVKTLSGQLDELKKVDPEKLKSEIERLQTENKTAKEKFESDLNNLKISNAIEKALTGAKAKNITAAKALLKMDDIKLDGENVKGIDEQIKALAEAEETKFLFDTETNTNKGMKGASPDTPPSGGAGSNESKGAQFAQRYNNNVFSRLGMNTTKE